MQYKKKLANGIPSKLYEKKTGSRFNSKYVSIIINIIPNIDNTKRVRER